MARSDVLRLIALTPAGVDENGIPRETETDRQVYCRVASVSQTEFFGGGRNGLNPEFKFTLFEGDYQEETLVEYRGRRYAVYRVYHVFDRDEVELYAERKGGTNGKSDTNRAII